MPPSLSNHKPSGENVLAVAETERPCLVSPGTDLCSFPSDKLQMWNSPAPCPREGCAVAERKAACDPLTQHFKQHWLSAARDALQLLSSVTKHSSSVYVSDSLCHLWTGSNDANLIKSAPLICRSEEIHTMHCIFGAVVMVLQGLCSNQICHPERQSLQSQRKEQYKHFVVSFQSDNNMSFFSDLEQVLQIPRAQMANCLSGKTDDEMGIQHRRTIRRQGRMQQQIIFKKHGGKL